jgi:hypothetical protein
MLIPLKMTQIGIKTSRFIVCKFLKSKRDFSENNKNMFAGH